MQGKTVPAVLKLLPAARCSFSFTSCCKRISMPRYLLSACYGFIKSMPLFTMWKKNRDLTRLLRSIKHSDFSQSFTSTIHGTTFEELNAAFNEVIHEFQRARAEKEEHLRYLQTVVQNVGIGLVAFKQNGEVDLINNAAKRIFKLARLRHINQLESVSKELVNILINLRHGDKALIKCQENDELLQLAVYATDFTLRQQKYKLISIQNIQSELEEKEMEAWQDLIRVLTHEIMNSVTPISSLASTANNLLTSHCNREESDMETGGETTKDVCNAVQTIEKRSQSLLSFVDNYRKLTRIPKLN